jgi:FMN phosphatase YigB (HAD superfamily)
MGSEMPELAFLLDVDNTLIDNDRVKVDLRQDIDSLVGPERGRLFWDLYEEVRDEVDYVDLPRTLERFSRACPEERGFPAMAALILGYPFERSLYPGALDAVAHLRTLGTVVILSDGDPVFQPAKVARSGIAAAAGGNVLIYPHKEQHIDEVRRRFPAGRYVLVDDKARILGQMGPGIVTVHVRQGSHAAEPHGERADFELDRIADISRLGAEDFLAAARSGARDG